MYLGIIYKAIGKLDQALVKPQISELNPDNHVAHISLGGIYIELDKLDLALASTLKSLELNR